MLNLTTEAVRIKGNTSLASEKTLDSIKKILSNSIITRKGGSSLETSLAILKKSTVTFNKKTMRWHDDQTNLMVKGTDPRVAEAMKPKKTSTEVMGGFLEEIKNSNQLIAEALTGTAEDKLESKVADAKATKEEKKQTGMLSGMWESMKKRAKENWFVQNWKKILATLFVLFAPLEWIKKIWEWMQKIWDFIAGKKATQKDVDKAQKLVDDAKQKWYETDEMFQKRVLVIQLLLVKRLIILWTTSRS